MRRGRGGPTRTANHGEAPGVPDVGQLQNGSVRAVVYEAFGARMTVRDVAEPSCPAHGVVVAVAATGLCRSDWHGWQGHEPGIPLPNVPGHELAGTVVEIGADVRGWEPGARVTVPFVCACGDCAPCRRGEQQVCERQTQSGFTQPGRSPNVSHCTTPT